MARRPVRAAAGSASVRRGPAGPGGARRALAGGADRSARRPPTVQASWLVQPPWFAVWPNLDPDRPLDVPARRHPPRAIRRDRPGQLVGGRGRRLEREGRRGPGGPPTEGPPPPT